MNEYKQRVVDFFDRRTAYDAEGDSHPHRQKDYWSLHRSKLDKLFWIWRRGLA
ncbi:MAG: hypothetical protein AAFO76_01795 [Cyanobacteria bacterium J06607_15]